MLEAMISRIESRSACPAILGGDLNTHTFARGTRLRAMMNTTTILGSKRDRLNHRLVHPASREPAILEFERFGFATKGFNDRSNTSRTIVSSLDDSSRLLRAMKWWVKRRVGPRGLQLGFRLDWLAARGMRALSADEMTDEAAGVSSIDAQTFQGLAHSGAPLSDHDPIVADVSLR